MPLAVVNINEDYVNEEVDVDVIANMERVKSSVLDMSSRKKVTKIKHGRGSEAPDPSKTSPQSK